MTYQSFKFGSFLYELLLFGGNSAWSWVEAGHPGGSRSLSLPTCDSLGSLVQPGSSSPEVVPGPGNGRKNQPASESPVPAPCPHLSAWCMGSASWGPQSRAVPLEMITGDHHRLSELTSSRERQASCNFIRSNLKLHLLLLV